MVSIGWCCKQKQGVSLVRSNDNLVGDVRNVLGGFIDE